MASSEHSYESLPASPEAEAAAKRERRKSYWTMALLNLLETGAAAGLVKYWPLFLAARGLDAAQVGVVLATAQAAKFAGGLVWGRAADATGRFKAVLLFTNALSVALALAFTSYVAPWRGTSGWTRVVVTAALVDAQNFVGASSGTLVDAIAVVRQSSGGADYGSLRLWAAVGWGAMALVIGACVDAFGFASIFVAYAVGTGLSSTLIALSFEDPPRDRRDDAAAPAKGSLRSVFLRGLVPLYFLNFFVHGCLAAFVESYLLLYVATRWPATPTWFLGLLILEAALFECPVFFYASDVLKRFGVRACLVGAQLLFAARCAAYAAVASYAGDSKRGYLWFLLLEPSHAVTFAMMWSAAVEYARQAAPPAHQGMAQALLRGTYYYLGIGAGSVVAGHVIRAKGYEYLYQLGAVAMCAWALVWALLIAVAKRRRGRVVDPAREDLLTTDVGSIT